VPAVKKRKQIVTTKGAISQSHGKRLKDRPEKIVYEGGDYCACNAYLVADWLWTSGHLDKDLWRRAVKRPHFSAYDLWLYESIGCARAGLYLPDVPSISGGYSRNNLIPGTTWQPPADCLNDPPALGNYIARSWWDPGHTRLYWLAFYGIDPSKFPGRTFAGPATLQWFYDIDDRSAYQTCEHTFDNFATSTKLYNLWPVPIVSGICLIHIHTTTGEHIVYQQDRIQPDGLDLPALSHISSVPAPGYEAKGRWE